MTKRSDKDQSPLSPAKEKDSLPAETTAETTSHEPMDIVNESEKHDIAEEAVDNKEDGKDNKEDEDGDDDGEEGGEAGDDGGDDGDDDSNEKMDVDDEDKDGEDDEDSSKTKKSIKAKGKTGKRAVSEDEDEAVDSNENKDKEEEEEEEEANDDNDEEEKEDDDDEEDEDDKKKKSKKKLSKSSTGNGKNNNKSKKKNNKADSEEEEEEEDGDDNEKEGDDKDDDDDGDNDKDGSDDERPNGKDITKKKSGNVSDKVVGGGIWPGPSKIFGRSFELQHLIRVHSRHNQSRPENDTVPQIWTGKFPPANVDTRALFKDGVKRRVIATVAEPSLCFIDIDSAKVIAQYALPISDESDRRGSVKPRDELFALDWTVFDTDAPPMSNDNSNNNGNNNKIKDKDIHSVVAIGGDSGLIRLIDTYHLGCYAHLSGHSSEINHLKFSEKHPRWLFSGSSDGTVRLWIVNGFKVDSDNDGNPSLDPNFVGATCVAIFDPNVSDPDPVYSLAIDPACTVLMSGGDGRIFMYDLESMVKDKDFIDAMSDSKNSIEFADMAATGSSSAKKRSLNASAIRSIRKRSSGAAVVPSDKCFMVEPKTVFNDTDYIPENAVVDMHFTRSGRLVTSGRSGVITVWNPQQSTKKRMLKRLTLDYEDPGFEFVRFFIANTGNVYGRQSHKQRSSGVSSEYENEEDTLLVVTENGDINMYSLWPDTQPTIAGVRYDETYGDVPKSLTAIGTSAVLTHEKSFTLSRVIAIDPWNNDTIVACDCRNRVLIWTLVDDSNNS
ncbi:WD40 repeat-like protein [Ramicandelaber brevisporus]|nr:WD40 repeat-like protein [Ramicandelaber brevisporus]